jgi:hypothetical protein
VAAQWRRGDLPFLAEQDFHNFIRLSDALIERGITVLVDQTPEKNSGPVPASWACMPIDMEPFVVVDDIDDRYGHFTRDVDVRFAPAARRSTDAATGEGGGSSPARE